MRLLPVIALILLVLSCKSENKRAPIQELNLELSKAIDVMSNRDKQMQINTLKFINADQTKQDEIEELKKQVFAKHAIELEEIIDQYGYPTENLVGQVSTKNFFALLNHTHGYPKVMNKGIMALEKAIETGEADTFLYVSLKDQYAFENNLPSSFGTVVQFNDDGQAIVPNDNNSINENRIAFGMDSLKNYLNLKTIQYFNLNRDVLESKGISRPNLYK